MEKFSQKWCIAALLEDKPVGYEFEPSRYPLHITLADVHAADWRSKQLIADFAELTKTIEPFTVKAQSQGNLGPEDNPTKVTFIEKSPALISLHEQIIGFLETSDAAFNNPEWNREGYIPHSTVQHHAQVLPSETVTISNLTLIDMYPNQNAHMRKIIFSTDL